MKKMKINWKIYFGVLAFFSMAILVAIVNIIDINPDESDAVALGIRDTCIAGIIIGNMFAAFAAINFKKLTP